MFLAIPIIAILKVIFDRVPALEPWGFVMGDDLPKTVKWRNLKMPSFDAGNSNATYVAKDTTPTDVISEKNTQSDTKTKE